MNDRFQSGGDSLTSPARHAFAITLHTTDTLPWVTKAICVGGAGTPAFRAVDSAQYVTLAVEEGQLLPIRITHIRATGTTATRLVGLS